MDSVSNGPQIGPQIGIRKEEEWYVFFKIDEKSYFWIVSRSRSLKNRVFHVFWLNPVTTWLWVGPKSGPKYTKLLSS